jgi:hypothetical protein
MDACRPAPVSAAGKATVLESLPTEGEVKHLTKSDRRKLAALDPVLRLHGRQGVYEILCGGLHKIFWTKPLRGISVAGPFKASALAAALF